MYEPKPEHKFTFGLWTVGNPGGDAFGQPVCSELSPADLVCLLGKVGAYGVNFHDNDLIPIDATSAERQVILKAFNKALADIGLVVPMATTNLLLKEKEKRFAADAEIQGLLAGIRADDGSMDAFQGAYTPEKAAALKVHAFDRQGLGARGMEYEKLDQLVNELLLGIR
jgi:hypothetical protein